MEFYYYLCGILLLPLWNFIITFMEFYYYLYGILLLPLHSNFGYKLCFRAPRNQVYNQVVIKYIIKSIYQEKKLLKDSGVLIDRLITHKKLFVMK